MTPMTEMFGLALFLVFGAPSVIVAFGVFVAPDPEATTVRSVNCSTTARRWPFVSRALGLGFVFILLSGAPVHASGRLLPTDEPGPTSESICEIQTINGNFSQSADEYKAGGRCTMYQLSGGVRQETDSIKWEAVGKYNPATKAADEKVSLLRLVRPDQPNYMEVGRITANMVCGQDPWLNPLDRFGCDKMFYGRSESLSRFDLAGLYASNRNVPRTSLLSSQQRAALNKQYQAFLALHNATHQQFKPGDRNMALQNPAVSKLYTTPSKASPTLTLPIAPTIIEPRANGFLIYRQSKFKISPSSNAAQIQIEFTRLDAPAGQQRVYIWEMPTNVLAQGADIPYNIFGTLAGRWKMRARTLGTAPSAFSADVPFQYVMQNPAVTRTPQRRMQLHGQ